jgi:DNA-binding response OmpR family regulator
VIILSNSNAELDVATGYELQANAYIVKPLGLDDFITAIRRIEEFWLNVVKLPRRSKS